MDIWNEGLVGAIIGAVIGGGASLLGTWLTLKSQRKQSIGEEKSRIRATAQAIHVEIRTVYRLYDLTMTVRIEQLPEGQPLHSYYPIGQDYFTVFRENAAHIGHIPDVEMRTAIIECYALTKSLIDTYRFNNELVAGYEASHLEYIRNPSDANDMERRQRAEAMVEYTDSIRESHKRALDSFRRADVMLTAALSTPIA